jgi:hypothetical protein
MRLVKFLVLLVVLAALAAMGVGFTAQERFEDRDTFVIDAAPERVWALVADPRLTGRWLPPEMAGGGIVDVKEAAPPTGTSAPSAGADPLIGRRFVYHQKDGKTITIEVVERVAGRRCVDRVVESSIGFEGYFPELAWGFEVAAAEGGRTSLSPIQLGRAARPFGTLMRRMMEWSGETPKMHAELARAVERAVKAESKGAAPAAAPAPPPPEGQEAPAKSAR